MSVCLCKRQGKDFGKYFVNYKEDGRVRRKWFGTGISGKAEAEVFNAIKCPVPILDLGSPFFQELASEYLTWKEPRQRADNFKTSKGRIKKHLVPFMGHVMATEITHQLLDQYVAMRAKKIKLSAVARDLDEVRAILNWSVKRKLILYSPMAGYDMPPRGNPKNQVLSQEEVLKLLAVCPPHLKRALLIAYYTGLRPGAVELFPITYSQINWSTMTILVFSADKGSDIIKREIPINPDLPLRVWYEEDGCNDSLPIIRWNGKAIKSAKTAFKNAKIKCGLNPSRKIPPYVFRHTFISALLTAGVDLKSISEMAGHDITTLLKVYAQVSTPTKVAAIQKLPTLFGEE